MRFALQWRMPRIIYAAVYYTHCKLPLSLIYTQVRCIQVDLHTARRAQCPHGRMYVVVQHTACSGGDAQLAHADEPRRPIYRKAVSERRVQAR